MPRGPRGIWYDVIIPQTGACDYGVLASNLYIGSCVLGFPSCAPKILPAKMLLGPQRNSKFRILEIYDLTECCCSPRQTHNSGVPQLFFRMPPLASPRKSCCSPSETQNLDVCNITSTIDTIKIIKKPQGFPFKVGIRNCWCCAFICVFI